MATIAYFCFSFIFFSFNNKHETVFFFFAAKNRRVLNAINEAMRRPVETLALFQQNDTGDGVPQPPDGIASNQGEEEAVDIDGGYTSSTSPGAVAAGTQRRTAGIRKRYRVLVEVTHPVWIVAHALAMREYVYCTCTRPAGSDPGHPGRNASMYEWRGRNSQNHSPVFKVYCGALCCHAPVVILIHHDASLEESDRYESSR